MTTDFHITEMLSKESSTELGDLRRTHRLSKLIQAIALNPEASFPSLFQTKGELEAVYRLIGNSSITWNQIQSGHYQQTKSRCTLSDTVLALHDTTNIHFKLHDSDVLRDQMVKVSSRKQGFKWHVTLAVAHSDIPTPLGLLTSQPFVSKTQLEQLNDKETNHFWRSQQGVYANEFQRWIDAVEQVRVGTQQSDFEVIHVMDRESDCFTLMKNLTSNQDRFVLRLSNQKRIIYDEESHHPFKVFEALKNVSFQDKLEVKLGFRTPFRSTKDVAKHPQRKSRKAILSLRAKSVLLKDPKDQLFQEKDSIRINVVEILEQNPPKSEKGIHWILWTTEPIDCFEDLLNIAEIYRRRWVIEDFFKAIKSGCKVEEKQFRSAHSILNCLSVLSIVAWWLLGVRAMTRSDLDIDWRLVITPLAFKLLKTSVPHYKWQNVSTLDDVLVAIAMLGGYLKKKEVEPPGWLTLIRGLQTLVQRVEGARLYAEIMGISDES